jgi:hypothetical protein
MRYSRLAGLAMTAFFNLGLAVAHAQQPADPAVGQAAYLVRTTIMSIHDANRSNNYSVLREMASPSLQATYAAADLAVLFSALRAKNFDLFTAASSSPQLTQPPLLTADGKMRVTGYFPTRPETIKFDLVFEAIGGVWRIADVGIAMVPAAVR